jgi:hypothetical protein
MNVPLPSKLKVRFDDPLDGWIGLTAACGSRTATIVVSYTPNDLFVDLIDALTRLKSFEGDTKVVAHDGSISFVLLFSRQKQKANFSIDRHETDKVERLFEFYGDADDVIVPFWRSLRDLQGRFSQAELTRRWHRRFAWDDIDHLTRLLTETNVNSIP